MLCGKFFGHVEFKLYMTKKLKGIVGLIGERRETWKEGREMRMADRMLDDLAHLPISR